MVLDFQGDEDQMNKKNVIITRYNDLKPYVTKDGSIIRELMHPAIHGNENLSLAEAIIAIGSQTFLHKHNKSEELYHIISGQGLMTLGTQEFEVKQYDTIYIAPNTPHKVKNIGKIPLKILCCCAPPYSHEDTVLLNDLPKN